MTRYRLTLLAATGLVAFSLLACGGDDDNGNGDTGDVEPTAEATGDDLEEPTEPEGEGDGASGDGDVSDIDMCALLTVEEIEAAAGNPVEEGVVDIGLSCDWDSDPDDTSVAVYLTPGIIPDLCSEAFVGDEAYAELGGYDGPAFTSFIEPSGGTADVLVCLDEGQFQLIVTGGLDDTPDQAQMQATAEELAQLALSRL